MCRDQQAKVQVEAMQDMVKGYDDALRKELATKGDIQDVKGDIRDVKFELLRWMVGIAVGQMAFIVAIFAFMK